MNHVLDMLEELMVKVEQHEITYIIFSVIALLYLGAILDLICCVHITRHDLRATEERLTDGHNKLAVRLQELEQAQKKLRRTAINNFRLTCNVGVEAVVLPENAVKEALEGVEEGILICYAIRYKVKTFSKIKTKE
jgi:hypothetical protein